MPHAIWSNYWYNYATEQSETRTHPPTTDADAVQYISQDETFQALYKHLREHGHSVIDALAGVLSAQVSAMFGR